MPPSFGGTRACCRTRKPRSVNRRRVEASSRRFWNVPPVSSGIPAMKNNPTGAMGLRDYLGWDWVSGRGLPVVNLPGCPVQPDNITETLLGLVLHLGGIGQPIELDEQGRPVHLFGRTAHESCDRAGLADSGQYSDAHGDGRCLVKLGCRG